MDTHPRTVIVAKARLEIQSAIDDIATNHNLTYVEAVDAIASVISLWSRIALRRERHPKDRDKGADEA